jgi:hypothetical protein
MIRHLEIGSGFLIAGFFFVFLGSALGLSIATYLAGVCYLVALFIYMRMSPIFGLYVGFLGVLLVIISPSPYIIAALFPLVGLFFSGGNKYFLESHERTRYSLFFCISAIYAYFLFAGFEFASGSHNLLTILVAYALIAEVLFFGAPSRLYIALILISFFVFGNRSSLFLAAAFIKRKSLLALFVFIALGFTLITLNLIEPPEFLSLLFDEGGFLYRSFKEPRAVYVSEFFEVFNFNNLSGHKWEFTEVPQTSSGFYDLHNSFLTIIVRDSYLGLFKCLLWAITIFYLPLGVFVAITFRALNDTFLLGGVCDLITYALIGKSILKLLKDIKIILNRYLEHGR